MGSMVMMKMNKTIMLLALAAAGAVFGQMRVRIPLAREEYDIGVEFDKAEAWKQKGEEFVKAHERNYFRFLEETKAAEIAEQEHDAQRGKGEEDERKS